MSSLQTVGLPFANTELTKVWSIPEFSMFSIEALLEVHRNNAAAWTQARPVVFTALRRSRNVSVTCFSLLSTTTLM